MDKDEVGFAIAPFAFSVSNPFNVMEYSPGIGEIPQRSPDCAF